jgi:DNA-binding LacI/PurR family transcriptional regulator
MRDVAHHAGVSTATVSRVLAGIGKPRPQIAAAVLAAVSELDYRPSGIARSLKLRSTRTLGLIVTDIENPFFPELVRAADDAAHERGYTILLGSAADDDERAMRYLDLMVDRRVDGLIVASSAVTERHWSWLVSAPIPVVVVNAEPSALGVSVIASDNEAGTRLAVEHLVALGHRRIGYISGPEAYTAAKPRLRGFQSACREAGLSPDATPAVPGDARVESGERGVARLLEIQPRVTAICCYNDLTAIGSLRALHARGLGVPDDMSVVGFDDIAAAAWVHPALTTVVQQKGAMGRLAVEHLARAIGSERPADPEVVRVPVHIHQRGSTAAPRGSADSHEILRRAR